MSKKKLKDKKQKGIASLVEFLEGDGMNVQISDKSKTGKGSFGDINITYQRQKYPIAVSRKESLPTESLEKEIQSSDSDMLIFRKNRKSWKVYMDLETLQKLLLHNKS